MSSKHAYLILTFFVVASVGVLYRIIVPLAYWVYRLPEAGDLRASTPRAG